MEKNIVVTDAKGIPIGRTYPKRAAGLVKHGRAEYASDCEIRLLHTHAPSVINKFDNTEDFFMSKIINFNAREFKPAPDLKPDGACRMVITRGSGNTEYYRLGNPADLSIPAGISCRLKLEKNTDYIFRFETDAARAVFGSNAEFNCAIGPTEHMEDRFVFPLGQSLFAPMLSKLSNDGQDILMRVYDIPFNTGDDKDYTVIFGSCNALVGVMPVLDMSVYDGLEDCSYQQWLARNDGASKNDEKTESKAPDSDLDELIKILQQSYHFLDEDFIYAVESKIARKYDIPYGESAESLSKLAKLSKLSELSKLSKLADDDDDDDTDDDSDGFELDLSNANLDDNEFANWLSVVQEGSQISITNSNFKPSDSGKLVIGAPSDGCIAEIANNRFTTTSLSMILAKLGDGCDVHFANCTEHYKAGQQWVRGGSADGCAIEIHYCSLSALTFALLIAKLGDGCVVDMHNCNITHDGLSEIERIQITPADGCVITAENTTMPKECVELIAKKRGDGTVFNRENFAET